MAISAVGPQAFSLPEQAQVSKAEESQAKAKALGVEYNHELLQNTIYCEVFEKVVTAIYCDINHMRSPTECMKELQEIAYQYLDHSESGLQCKYSQILRVSLYSTHSDLSVIASVLLKALETKIARPFEAPDVKTERKEFPTWAEATGYTAEKIVVSFGGGERFLNAFLEGKTDGYTTENGAVGIFVTTDKAFRKRDIDYATRTAILHFDNPCILIAKIDPKLLLKVNCNSYEAVLPPEHIRFLNIIDISAWNMVEVDFDQRRALFEQMLPLGKYDQATQKFSWVPFLEEIKDPYIHSKIPQISRWYDYLLYGFKPTII